MGWDDLYHFLGIDKVFHEAGFRRQKHLPRRTRRARRRRTLEAKAAKYRPDVQISPRSEVEVIHHRGTETRRRRTLEAKAAKYRPDVRFPRDLRWKSFTTEDTESTEKAKGRSETAKCRPGCQISPRSEVEVFHHGGHGEHGEGEK